jgi:hypothetical protein
MAYKKITAVTFDVLSQMSEYLFQNQNNVTYSEIQKKVADYLVTHGEKKFIEIFNETEKTKNYVKALDTFKI